MTRNYYCLVAGLPEIIIEQNKLSFSTLDFKIELKEQLHPDDYKIIDYFFLPIDNRNLLNLLLGTDKAFEPGGKYTQAQLEEAIKDPEGLESYMLQFINAYKDGTPLCKGVSWENQLTALYYHFILSMDNKFVRAYYTNELQLKNILAALNCKKYKLDTEKELIGEGEFIEHLIKSTARDFGLSSEIPQIEKLVYLFENDDLMKREWDLDIIRWDFLDEKTVFEYFSFEKVFSYLIKLDIIERWLKLDIEAGRELFNRFIKELESSYEFPKEYAL